MMITLPEAPVAGADIPLSAYQRVLEHVVTSAGCWEWAGPTERDGWPTIRVGRVPHSVPRLLYQAVHGDAPAGVGVSQACQTRHCCNPAHHYIWNQLGDPFEPCDLPPDALMTVQVVGDSLYQLVPEHAVLRFNPRVTRLAAGRIVLATSERQSFARVRRLAPLDDGWSLVKQSSDNPIPVTEDVTIQAVAVGVVDLLRVLAD